MLYKPLIRVFLFGNAVHERLIPLLNEKQVPIDNNCGSIFVRSKDTFANEQDGFRIFTSPCVPHNTHLIVLPQDRNYADMQPYATDSIYFVNDWTFLNSDSMETAKAYRQKYPYTELRIVLFVSNRKTLSTDITDIQTALDSAVSEYEREGFSVTLIQKNEVSKLFFWQNRKYQDMLRCDFRKKLQNAKDALGFNYELHYKLLSEMLKDDMLNPEALERFTRYDEVLGVSKINNITDAAAKYFFSEDSLFIKELNGIFKEVTKSVCLWDENKMFRNLAEILTQ